ncbi:hypothetical protein QM012_003942 [Aureobasidium pullulans]|uniref:F-box domain-containing protein n=1 Tax=Aureobasidium pullulans TaxID=5580 RepID=A0ABR0T8F6_AURPU
MALLDLPPELLLRISAFLTTSELGKSRLTSKNIEAVLFDSFAREFFTKKQFMLEQISLQALIDISNHPTLASRLSEVVISSHVFPSDPEILSVSGKAMYQAGYVDHDVLMASGQAIHMLAEAFSKLPNLRTVGLRDYNGLGRYRDGEFATWKSWGWSFGWDRLPAYDADNPNSQRGLRTISPEPVLPVLFYALGHAKVVPESIHVFLRKRSKLTQQSFNILDGYLGEKVRPVLGNMKELMLAIGNDTTPYYYHRTIAPTKSEDASNLPLARLLHRTPKLETLRLNFEPSQPFASGFLDWLGSPVSRPATNPVTLPRLTALELGMLTVPAATLLKVLSKFDLESFSLWKVKLHASSASDPENCWQALLHDLATALNQKTSLKSVLIGFPSQLHCGRAPFDIEDACYFKPVGAGEEDIFGMTQEAKHYAGPGTSMADWLEELSQRTYVPPPEDDSDSLNSEDEGLNDGEGEDEDNDDEDDDDDDDN